MSPQVGEVWFVIGMYVLATERLKQTRHGHAPPNAVGRPGVRVVVLLDPDGEYDPGDVTELSDDYFDPTSSSLHGTAWDNPERVS